MLLLLLDVEKITLSSEYRSNAEFLFKIIHVDVVQVIGFFFMEPVSSEKVLESLWSVLKTEPYHLSGLMITQ